MGGAVRVFPDPRKPTASLDEESASISRTTCTRGGSREILIGIHLELLSAIDRTEIVHVSVLFRLDFCVVRIHVRSTDWISDHRSTTYPTRTKTDLAGNCWLGPVTSSRLPLSSLTSVENTLFIRVHAFVSERAGIIRSDQVYDGRDERSTSARAIFSKRNSKLETTPRAVVTFLY